MPLPPRNLLRGLLRPPTLAHAHSGTNSYVFVFVDRGRIHGTVQMLTHDLGHAVADYTAGADDSVAVAQRYALDHFEVGPVQGPGWEFRFTGARHLEDNGTYLILSYEVQPDPTPMPDEIRVRFDGIIHADHHHEAVVTVHHEVGFGSLRIRTTERYRLTAGSEEVVVSVERPSTANHAVASSKAIISRLVRLGRRAIGSRNR